MIINCLFNVSKNNYMIFRKPKHVVYDNEVLINGRPLQGVRNTRFLGATVPRESMLETSL